MTTNKLQQLQTLIESPKDEYIALAKQINPNVTDNDLRDMFPPGWEAKHFDSVYNYDSFRKHQIIIDAQLEELFCGGYQSNDNQYL